jgi:hypothetical protein
MTEEARQFTTCPHCKHEADIPDAPRVAWVVHRCIACERPYVHPKSIEGVDTYKLTDEELLSLSVDSIREEERVENEQG